MGWDGIGGSVHELCSEINFIFKIFGEIITKVLMKNRDISREMR
jgi:hypothetical protein